MLYQVFDYRVLPYRCLAKAVELKFEFETDKFSTNKDYNLKHDLRYMILV